MESIFLTQRFSVPTMTMHKTAVVFLFVSSCFFSFFPPLFSNEKDEISAIEEKEFSPDGEWDSFMTNYGEVVKKTANVYVFEKDKKWSVLNKEENNKTQGTYLLEKQVVYLFIELEKGKMSEDAIPVIVQDDNRMTIDNPFIEESSLLLFRRSALPALDKKDICGDWIIFQKTLDEKKETRQSPYVITIKDDDTYKLTHSEKKDFSEAWGAGTWEIQDGFLKIKNDAKDAGFWSSPVFFLFQDRLIYNNSSVCVWAERIKKETNKK